MKLKHILVLLALLPASVFSANSLSEEARPWTFWYWMYGAVSRSGIHADLCAMKDIGLGGCYLMPIRSSKEKPEFGGRADQLSPEFWSMVDYAFQQADSLGLQMGIHICDGFALAGFPTITPKESMQKVVWTDTIANGRDLMMLNMKQPESYEGYYEDIATIAMPCHETPCKWTPDSIRISDNISNKKGYWLASGPASITYSFNKPVTVRSMYIEPEGNNVQSERLLVEASTDGRTFYRLRQLVPPRQGWQNTSCGYTFALPETTARYFRFTWTPSGTEPGSEDLDAAKWKPLLKLRDITLTSESRIDNYEGKAAFVWRIPAGENKSFTDEGQCVKPKDCIVLSIAGKKQPLNNVLPSGKYRVLRIGHTSTGQMNATAGGGKGLEVDKFSKSATEKLLAGWFLKFLQRPNNSVVKYLHVDSWECGSQNWGENFADEFRRRRGYDLTPYLPVMCGIPVESVETTDKVLADVRKTINDLVNEVFFKTVSDIGHEHGMLVSHESIAPTFPADGIEHYKYSDVPMGEFWLNSPTHDKPCDMLDAVSGAHVYGKNIVQAEGFTEVRGTWDETPATLKPLLDRNLCLGMNRLFFHVDAHNPWLDRQPGMTLDGIGLFFQRDNTWYKDARGLVEYITRCQTELQKGSPVIDIAVFTGEDIPSRSLTPDRLVPMLPGLFGEDRVESEKRRIDNAGLPMEESPVGVTHSANIFSFDGWSNALHGYKYDCVNKDGLLSMQHPHFKVLVLPQYYAQGVQSKPLSVETKEKIEELRHNGINIIDKPYANADLSALGLQRDVILPDGMDFCHRHTDSCEIYFVTNQQTERRNAALSFRGTFKSAAYMNTVNGNKYRLECKNADGRTEVELPMDANGSVIVWLGDSISAECATSPQGNGNTLTLNGKWNLRFNKLGRNEEWTCDGTTGLDWTKNTDPQIANYSGGVAFSTEFKMKKAPETCVLMLGDVRDVAHVYVNGTDCGIAWTAPYEVDVTKAVRKGKNKLEIIVTNTWHNALQAADDGQPPYPGIWTNAKYRTKSKALLPAGLLSPVKIKTWE